MAINDDGQLRLTKGGLVGGPLGRRMRSVLLEAAPLALIFGACLALPSQAGAATVNPVQNTTYNLSPSSNPVVFGSGTNIQAYNSDGVVGFAPTAWNVTNAGNIYSGVSYGYGMLLDSPSQLTNTGNISSYNIGVDFGSTATLINGVTGVIGGTFTGVAIAGKATVTNSGQIDGSYYNGDGLLLGGGGSLTNASTGVIAGGSYGLLSLGAPVTVSNSGQISSSVFGAAFQGGMTFTNQTGGAVYGHIALSAFGEAPGTVNTIVVKPNSIISGGYIGILVSQNAGKATTTITNGGTVEADTAIRIDGGAVINQAGGGVIGGTAAISIGAMKSTVTNAGLVSGAMGVQLGGGGTLTNGSTGSIVGKIQGGAAVTFSNAGAWQSTGVSSFGGGVVTNTGVIVAGTLVNPAPAYAAVFNGVGSFKNGSASVTGTVRMANGTVGDALAIHGGPFVGATGHSSLFMDAFLGGPGSQADQLNLFNGSSGQTLIRINDTNGGAGAVNSSGIVLVTGATAASNFTIDPHTTHYDTAHKGIDHGPYLYTLQFKSGQEVLVGQAGSPAHQLATSLTAGQAVWASTSFAPSGGWPGAGAAGFAGDAATFDRPRIWTSALNTLSSDPLRQGMFDGAPGRTQPAVRPNLRLSTVQSSSGFDTGYDQGLAMLKGGVDLVRHEGPRSAFAFGLGTAYVQSDQRFTDGGAAMAYDGVVYGAYAGWRSGGAHADATVKSAMLKARYQAPWLTDRASSANLTSTGVELNAGYAYALSPAWTLEPLASTAVQHTSMSRLQLGATSALFDPSTSGWANFGARLQGRMRRGAWLISGALTARAWDRFGGDNRAYLSDLASEPLYDRITGVSGEVAAELNVASREGASAFVQTSARAGARRQDASALMGLRLSW